MIQDRCAANLSQQCLLMGERSSSKGASMEQLGNDEPYCKLSRPDAVVFEASMTT